MIRKILYNVDLPCAVPHSVKWANCSDHVVVRLTLYADRDDLLYCQVWERSGDVFVELGHAAVPGFMCLDIALALKTQFSREAAS